MNPLCDYLVANSPIPLSKALKCIIGLCLSVIYVYVYTYAWTHVKYILLT
jgi:hypothetical protein